MLYSPPLSHLNLALELCFDIGRRNFENTSLLCPSGYTHKKMRVLIKKQDIILQTTYAVRFRDENESIEMVGQQVFFIHKQEVSNVCPIGMLDNTHLYYRAET